MGWCHGRLSEGLDFKDDAARLVCVIGIPNLPIYAPDVKIKREYLDSLEKNRGKSWYFS
jgi:regulator of telomere elongation helicase 1